MREKKFIMLFYLPVLHMKQLSTLRDAHVFGVVYRFASTLLCLSFFFVDSLFFATREL